MPAPILVLIPAIALVTFPNRKRCGRAIDDRPYVGGPSRTPVPTADGKNPPTAKAVGGFHRAAISSTKVDFIRPQGRISFSRRVRQSIPLVRSSKRVPRFDFQKSAIFCRFLKVRLTNISQLAANYLFAQDDTRGGRIVEDVAPYGKRITRPMVNASGRSMIAPTWDGPSRTPVPAWADRRGRRSLRTDGLTPRQPTASS